MRRGLEEHFALDYETVFHDADKLFDEETGRLIVNEWGELTKINIVSDGIDKSFDNLQELFDYLTGEFHEEICYVVVNDLIVFFSYLYPQYLCKMKLLENANDDIYKKSENNIWKFRANAKSLYYVKVKINNTILLFIDAKSKLKVMPETLRGLYDKVMEIESIPAFKNLFFKLSGSTSIESFAVNKFLSIGKKDEPWKNRNDWISNHPSLKEDFPIVYKVFQSEQKQQAFTLAYRAALMARVGHYDNAIKYDCNNMYPSILCKFAMPYGKPHYTKGDPIENPFYKGIDDECRFLHIHQLNGFRNATEDLNLDAEPLDLDCWMWSFEFKELIRNHPEIEYEIIESYGFSAVQLDQPHQDYLKNNYRLYKLTGNKMYKYINNVIYGKFSQREIDVSFMPYLNEDDILKFKELHMTEPYVPQQQYYPLGSAIVARGRMIISQILHNDKITLDDIIYIDTDCFALIKNERTTSYINEAIKVGNQFGEWKLELDDEFDVYGVKAYYGKGVDKIVEANAGAGKFSESEYFDPATGQSITTILKLHRAPQGYVRLPVKINTTRGEK